MSEQKRPQSKDISDLKARLGLKKGAEQAPAASPGPAAPPAAAAPRPPTSTFAAVAPPPGISVPAPPGAAAPVSAPPQPQIPNASEDPFGAMNAMAQARAVQRPPDIVIVNDGKPVEELNTSKKGIQIAKVAIPTVAALAIGLAIGQMAKGAKHFNAGIDAAGDILTVVKDAKKTVASIDTALDDAAKSNFRASKELTDSVKTLAGKLDIKEEIVFRYKQNALDSVISGRTLAYFAMVSELKSMMDTHVKSAQMDDLALSTGKEKTDKATVKPDENAVLAGGPRYGVLLTNPTAEDIKNDGGGLGAVLVELGKPVCGDGNISSSPGCADKITGFAYRQAAGSAWNKGTLAEAAPGDKVAPKSLLMFAKNGTLDEILKGSQESAAAAMYTKRLRQILEKTKKVVEEGAKLDTDLTKKSKESKKFTFLL